jgi:predicted phosphoadenosine phosphosulfate sulfurtransferase
MNNQKPYIVKFSGGRSSAMMLMKLLKNNQLNPKRGDVIIFNNTSAEHSATYEFTRQMKKNSRIKIQYPFFLD